MKRTFVAICSKVIGYNGTQLTTQQQPHSYMSVQQQQPQQQQQPMPYDPQQQQQMSNNVQEQYSQHQYNGNMNNSTANQVPTSMPMGGAMSMAPPSMPTDSSYQPVTSQQAMYAPQPLL